MEEAIVTNSGPMDRQCRSLLNVPRSILAPEGSGFTHSPLLRYLLRFNARLRRVLRLPHLLFVDLPSADPNVPPTPSCSRATGTPIA